jgi:hypothetical protein
MPAGMLPDLINMALPQISSKNHNIPFGEKWNHKGNFKKGTTLAFFTSNRTNCFFASTFGIPYANAGGVEVTPERLHQFGRSLFKTVVDFTSEKTR